MSATGVVGEMLAEAGLEPDESGEVAEFLAALQTWADAEPPPPSAALATVLTPGVTALTPRRGTNRSRRVAAGVAALALATLAGTGVAAASDRLPDPAQRLAERFSQHFLPFDFPAPGADDPHRPAHPSGSRQADSAGETLTGPQSPGDASARSTVASASPARQPHARRGDAGSAAPAPMGGRSGDGGDDHSSGPSGRGGSDDGPNDDATADNSGDHAGGNADDHGDDNGGNQSGNASADGSGDGSGSQSGHQSGHDDSAGSSDGGSHSGPSGSGDGGSGGGSGGDGSDSGGGADGQSG